MKKKYPKYFFPFFAPFLLIPTLFSVQALAIDSNLVHKLRLQPIPQSIAHNQPVQGRTFYTTSSQAQAIGNKLQALMAQPATAVTGNFAQQRTLSPRLNSSFASQSQRLTPQVQWRKNNTPLQVRGAMPVVPAGTFQSTQDLNVAKARAFVRAYRGVIGIREPDLELNLEKQFSDADNQQHIRFTQSYRGLPVWPANVTVHLQEDSLSGLLNGAFIRSSRKPMPTTPLIQEEEARKTAVTALPERAFKEPEPPELIIYSPGNHPPALAWKYEISAGQLDRWLVVVDAITGDILTRYNEIQNNRTMGSGQNLTGQLNPLNIWEYNNTYYLVDTSKAMFQTSSMPSYSTPDPDRAQGAIFTLDLHNQTAGEGSTISQISSTTTSTGWLSDGVSASYNLGQVYDYFLDRHNRNSIDGNGGTLYGIVRTEQGMNNAYWNGQAMFFGDGMPFAGALDVVGHELTHGVTQHTANLVYRDQPGALNEAMSDIFGEMVEARTNGQTDWKVGSIFSSPARDMKDPASLSIGGGFGSYPAHMNNYITTSEDNGGVHLNSSIINHAYYLLAEGLPGAIGLQDAEHIFYRALSTHLVANSQFIDARLAAITSAEEIFGQGSSQSEKVKEAFDAVGIDVGAGTPPPPDFPEVSGTDATLFTCLGPQATAYFLCRQDPSYDDSSLGVYLSRYSINSSKPASVSGNGVLSLFVDSINDMCMLSTDGNNEEQCLGFPGWIHSVAMSADGNRIAFIMLDSTGQPDNKISIIDLTADTTDEITLRAPALDGISSNTILYADAMNFTADGSMLIFDALNVLQMADNSVVDLWSIYGLDIASGQTFSIVPPVNGIDTSYPSRGNTSDNFILFAASEPGSGQSTVFAGNLNNGQLKEVTQAAGEYTVASYTGNDLGIVYDTLDTSVPTGYSLLSQNVAGDHITPTGESETWIRDGVVPTVYRRGDYSGPSAVTGYYDPDTQYLFLGGIQVPGAGVWQVEMVLSSASPLRFTIADALGGQTGNSANGSYDPGSTLLTIPAIEITDANSSTNIYSAQMRQVGNEFEVISLNQLR